MPIAVAMLILRGRQPSDAAVCHSAIALRSFGSAARNHWPCVCAVSAYSVPPDSGRCPGTATGIATGTATGISHSHCERAMGFGSLSTPTDSVLPSVARKTIKRTVIVGRVGCRPIEGRGPSTRRRAKPDRNLRWPSCHARDFQEEVAPLGIGLLDQCDFSGPRPFLQCLLA